LPVVLGTGAHGVVCAWQGVALKVGSPLAVHQHEVQVLQTLGAHENIIGLVRTVSGMGAMVLELADTSLGKCEASTAHLLGAARGLCHVHAMGFVHMDVKLDNILVMGAGGPVKLCDFGQSQRIADAGCSSYGGGTRGHVGPEQVVHTAEGVYGVTRAADVWAFGILMWQVWAGFGDFGVLSRMCQHAEEVARTCSSDAAALAALTRELGCALRRMVLTRTQRQTPSIREQQLVEWCLRINPEERPPMGKVVEELEAMLSGSSPSLRPDAHEHEHEHDEHAHATCDGLHRAAAMAWRAGSVPELPDDMGPLEHLDKESESVQRQCVAALGPHALDLPLLFELHPSVELGKRIAEGLFLACLRHMDPGAPGARVIFGNIAGFLAVSF